MGMDNIDKNKQNDNIINVPQILLQYPPLAVLTNGFIKSFNELREFVTYSVMLQCKEILINSIQSTVNCIRKFSVTSHYYSINNEKNKQNSNVRKDDNNDNDNDNDDIDDTENIDDLLSNLVKVECEYLLPFICDIFDLIFERRKEIEIDNLLQYFSGL